MKKTSGGEEGMKGTKGTRKIEYIPNPPSSSLKWQTTFLILFMASFYIKIQKEIKLMLLISFGSKKGVKMDGKKVTICYTSYNLIENICLSKSKKRKIYFILLLFLLLLCFIIKADNFFPFFLFLFYFFEIRWSSIYIYILGIRELY